MQTIEPMKCEKIKPFDSARYLFEPKVDGHRCRIEDRGTVLDGEVAVLDAAGVPRLRLVQQRGQSGPAFLRLATKNYPAVYYPFDILQMAGRDVQQLPTRERKRLLAETLAGFKPSSGLRCYSSGSNDITARFPELQDAARYKELPYVVGDGRQLYEKVCGAGWEGIVAKPLDAPYVGGNRGLWKKCKRPRSEGSFLICGACFPRPDSNREGWVGSVILGEVTPNGLVYRGEVGTGFDFSELAWLTANLKRQDACPFNNRPKGLERFWFWCQPSLTAEVDFFERTADDMLREPVVKRLLR